MKCRIGRAVGTLKKAQGKTCTARSLSSIVSLFVFFAALMADEAFASEGTTKITNGFSNCTYSKGQYETTFSVTMNFLDTGLGPSAAILQFSRGIIIYVYTKEGAIAWPPGQPNTQGVASSVKMNGASFSGMHGTPGYYLRYYSGRGVNYWDNLHAFTATIDVVIPNYQIFDWPAISLQAGFHWADLVGGNPWGHNAYDSSGLVYIAPGNKGCQVLVEPENPPPAVSPTVTMTAPDWDLGELPRGEETVLTLPAAKDQLCFTYEGAGFSSSQKFLINATNNNGLSADGRYLLKSLEDSSQTVPYTLALANSTDSVLLPNIQNSLFSLNIDGRTCFTPTFKVQPDKAVKGGAYSDILTYTIVTKP